jgi:uncharacterized sporulation protein YeaH/YhbH (DUF444 family)
MRMSYIIDRRLNGKKKSAVNRQRFLDRYKQQIRKAVNEAVAKRSIKGMEQGEEIVLPSQGIQEPTFRHGSGGKKTIVAPGNKSFQSGDLIPKPESSNGSGSGEGDASEQGEGTDDFVFQITQEEFLNFLFEDLALPNLIKRQLAGVDAFQMKRAGFIQSGTPSRINIVRSLKQATGRRLALGASIRNKIKQLELELTIEKEKDFVMQNPALIVQLEQSLKKFKTRLLHIPFIDDLDLRYNHFIKTPRPMSKAVMFCIMDVSGSMTQKMKDMAKRFFVLLYLFLKRNYKQIEVVFIRHHTTAQEVDEETFFYARETGGTVVSSALNLTLDIIQKRYSSNEWNIYAAQASDGDNWNDDSPICANILRDKLLPLLQYFAYVEITPRRHQALWHEYVKLQEEHPNYFALQQILDNKDIYSVFRELFQKRETLTHSARKAP